MSVSNEDRKAAITIVAGNIQGAGYEFPTLDAAHHAVDALIADGWGPRPTVSAMKLGEFIDQANAGGMAVPWRGLQDYLRDCGIEVTE